VAKRDPDLAKFGPDATFSAVADWLTENIELIDDFFSSLMAFTHIWLGEHMVEQHAELEQSINPRPYVNFETRNTLRSRLPHSAFHKKLLKPFEQAWLERFASLRSRCVIRDDIYYQEALDLTIWQGGSAFGMLRHPGISGGRSAPEREISEQYFVWSRRGDRYVGERLEIRLWGLYVPDMVSHDRIAVREIQATPAKLLTNSEILAGRDTGYVALYQMQRPPNRVDIRRKSISAIYEGENDAVRSALSGAEETRS
jgi:hypothetical protein